MQTAEGITWERDFESALQRAKSENKLVLLDVLNPG